jgi:hypothetical protein
MIAELPGVSWKNAFGRGCLKAFMFIFLCLSPGRDLSQSVGDVRDGFVAKMITQGLASIAIPDEIINKCNEENIVTGEGMTAKAKQGCNREINER